MDTSSYPAEAWKRLGRAVKARRNHLGMTQPQVATSGGPSTAVVSKIERAAQQGYEDAVIVKLENALGLRRDAVEGLLRTPDKTRFDEEDISRQQEAARTERVLPRGDVRAEVPAYVTRDQVEDWEWEIWTQLSLLSDDDKALMIEFMKGVRRRAARAEAGQDAAGRRLTG
ncbi:hypothetical protein [Actinoallomurus sp. CA-142502]|uniref:hypothetical protein n=1 Tax=Actinoallomurus sp. CA-142502 TaxID=3239885 RepID=UPI003D8C9045